MNLSGFTNKTNNTGLVVEPARVAESCIDAPI
jgi:hypothetical protein